MKNPSKKRGSPYKWVLTQVDESFSINNYMDLPRAKADPVDFNYTA